MNYGFGEITNHYAFCKYDDCGFITGDFHSQRGAEEEILEHLADVHDDNGD